MYGPHFLLENGDHTCFCRHPRLMITPSHDTGLTALSHTDLLTQGMVTYLQFFPNHYGIYHLISNRVRRFT